MLHCCSSQGVDYSICILFLLNKLNIFHNKKLWLDLFLSVKPVITRNSLYTNAALSHPKCTEHLTNRRSRGLNKWLIGIDNRYVGCRYVLIINCDKVWCRVCVLFVQRAPTFNHQIRKDWTSSRFSIMINDVHVGFTLCSINIFIQYSVHLEHKVSIKLSPADTAFARKSS